MRQHWSRQSVAEPLTSYAAHIQTGEAVASTPSFEDSSWGRPGRSAKYTSALAYCSPFEYRMQVRPNSRQSGFDSVDDSSISVRHLSMLDASNEKGGSQEIDVSSLDRSCSAMSLL